MDTKLRDFIAVMRYKKLYLGISVHVREFAYVPACEQICHRMRVYIYISARLRACACVCVVARV